MAPHGLARRRHIKRHDLVRVDLHHHASRSVMLDLCCAMRRFHATQSIGFEHGVELLARFIDPRQQHIKVGAIIASRFRSRGGRHSSNAFARAAEHLKNPLESTNGVSTNPRVT